MTNGIAAVVFALAIAGLFWLDRDPKSRTSKALWIPVLWLLIVGSRNISAWLGATPTIVAPNAYLDGSPLDRFVFTILLVSGLMVLISRGKKVRVLLLKNGPIVLFFAYCALSILWSDFPGVAFKRWNKGVGDLVMVLIVLTDSDPIAATKRFLARTGFLLLPISVLFIKYYPELGRGYNAFTWTRFFVGVTESKNSLGMICMLSGLGATWRLLREFHGEGGTRRTGPLVAQCTLLAMALWLMWIANSVTSLSCFLVAGGLMVLTSRPALVRRRAVVHILVAVTLAISFSALFLNSGAGLLEDMGRDATLTGRTEIWSDVLSMNTNPLLGTGFESFWLGPRLEQMWAKWYWHPNEAHNGYIEVYLELGWIGEGLLALLLATGYWRIVGAVCLQQKAAILMLAYFVVAVIYNFTESAIRILHPAWIFLLWGTIAASETPVREGVPLTTSSADMPPALVAARSSDIVV